MTGPKSFFTKTDSKVSFPSSEEITAFLGKETVFEGKMTFQGIFRLEGKFDGEIFQSGTLVVGETGVVKGKIAVQAIIIHGLVEGEIEAGSRVEIHSTGKFCGNLFTPVFVIHEGGFFQGQCQMERIPEKVEKEGEGGEEGEEGKLRPLFLKKGPPLSTS